uniref:Reverse transcriptase domain-containing protein n=1 Tax=Lactuca sativa TaxID=4236 RepID=A0A9R1XG60_LACSA|nr:hypothetical protein LSAT_V11C400190820 [Lactuca sativa]
MKLKEQVWKFFASKFDEDVPIRPKLINSRVDGSFSRDEIKEVVWCCVNDKPPGLDEFAFRVMKEFWDIIKIKIFNHIKNFESRGEFSRDCNASFISLISNIRDTLSLKDYMMVNLIGCMYKILSKILSLRIKKFLKIVGPEQSAYIEGRSILDGPLVLNELYTWTKKKKKKALVFKVDFDKAFDLLNWHYLDTIMEQMEFSKKWIVWIKGCLVSKRASIFFLMDPPPQSVLLEKGLKYLWILIQETFYSRIKLLLNKEEIKLLKDKMNSKALYYRYSRHNFSVIMHEACDQHKFNGIALPKDGPILSHIMLLKCFFIASELKVNLHKSKVFGIGVDDFEINSLATPIKVIDTLEGIRRRFLWGEIDYKRKINWVAWSTLVKPKTKGGLDISQTVVEIKLESNALWSKSIKSWHNILGVDGKPLAKAGLSVVL